jgi:hypothetical protein
MIGIPLQTLRVFTFFLLSQFFGVKAFIVTATYIMMPSGCKVFLDGDIHVPSTSNFPQAAKVDALLQREDLISLRKLHVLFEQPDDIYCEQEGFLTSFKKLSEQTIFTQTTIENIEQRCISSAAQYLLSENTTLEEIQELSLDLYTNSCDRICYIYSVSFQDVLYEFTLLQEKLAQLFHSYQSDDVITKLYEDKLKFAERACELLKKELKKNNINLGSPIRTLIELYGERPPYADKISASITDTFSPLLDLFIFYKILSSQKNEDFIVITGDDHTWSVQTLLIGMGGEVVNHSWSSRKQPLTLNQLDIFNKRHRCCCTLL